MSNQAQINQQINPMRIEQTFLTTSTEWAMSPHGIINATAAANALPNMPSEVSALDLGDLREMLSPFIQQRKPTYYDQGNAFIDIRGPLMNDGTMFQLALGATGYEEIIEDLYEAELSNEVEAIYLTINSPGGHASGIQEVVNVMAEISKPIYAYCSGLACSAAYYLAAGAKSIAASPSADVGNIGTILHWMDVTGFWEKMGVKSYTLTNEGADLKGTFRESPISEAQLEFLQSRVNALGLEFQDYVFASRPFMSDEVKRAGWYRGDAAGELGLVDMIGTLPEFIMVQDSKKFDIGNA